VSTRAPTAIDELANAYLGKLAALDPLSATAWGLLGHDSEMTDFSPSGYAERESARVAALAAFRAATPTDETDRVTLAIAEWMFAVEGELYASGEHRVALNNLASPLQDIRDVFDIMPAKTADDWATIAARMAKIPAAIDGYIATLREGIRAGQTIAIRQVEEGISQAADLADPSDSFFVKLASGWPPHGWLRPDSAEGPMSDSALANDLARAGQVAAAAYGKLVEFFSEELAPHARKADAVGRERYEVWSRYFVGAKVDLDETYEWGLDELAKVTAEQEAVAGQIAGPGASVEQAIDALDHDSHRLIRGKKALRRWMQQTADAAIAALDGRYFDIPDPVKQIEAVLAPTENGGIYYTSPSEDFSRPGRMWWSVPPGVTRFGTWREKTTVYHEGVPGHHLQLGIATYLKDHLNAWRRLACFTSGHGEGWALYAERLMQEFGFLEDSGDLLGMLDGQRMRATRVVLDIGVHLGKPAPARYGGGIWDAGKAWQLMQDNVHSPAEFNRFEVTRYLGWAGQAPSYKLGQRCWERLREAAAARAGADFDLKAFHAKALALGSLPLSVLQTALTN
jgi:uncharacterized protein (DUF885 family)